MLLLGAALAHAQAPGCDPLDAAQFVVQVRNAQDELANRMERAAFVAVVSGLKERIPCLVFAPSERLWADYLVLETLLEFAQGGDWEVPLQAALQIRPQVDRGVGGSHPVARYVPKATTVPPSKPVEPGIHLIVDGQESTRLPTGTGPHLVQREEGGVWRSMVHRADDPATVEWLMAPFRAGHRWTWQGHASFVLGPGGGIQRRWDTWPFEVGQAGNPVPDYPNRGWWTAWPAVSARGTANYGRLSILGEVGLGLLDFARVTGTAAQAFVAYNSRGGMHLGVGAGVGAGTHQRGVAGPEWTFTTESLPFSYGALTLQRWRPRGELGLTVGAGPASQHGLLFAGVHPAADDGRARFRLGLQVAMQRSSVARPAEAGVPSQGGDHVNWRAGVELGVHRGTQQR